MGEVTVHIIDRQFADRENPDETMGSISLIYYSNHGNALQLLAGISILL